MEIVERKFGNIFYKHIENSGDNPTLLFLHGFTGNSSVWDDYAEALKNKFNILLIDLAGHGKSGSPKTIEGYLFQRQAERIAELVNALNIKSISIISYSFSCYIGLALREILGEETIAMVLISPYFKEDFNSFEKLAFKGIRFIWRYLIPNKKSQLDYAKLRNYENPSFTDTKYILKCTNTKDILGSIYSLINREEIPGLESLKIPLLIIYGQNDKILSLKTKNLFSKLKTAEIKIIENKKHLFLKTESSKIAETIKTFLVKSITVAPQWT